MRYCCHSSSEIGVPCSERVPHLPKLGRTLHACRHLHCVNHLHCQRNTHLVGECASRVLGSREPLQPGEKIRIQHLQAMGVHVVKDRFAAHLV